jgi:hypothetical protein
VSALHYWVEGCTCPAGTLRQETCPHEIAIDLSDVDAFLAALFPPPPDPPDQVISAATADNPQGDENEKIRIADPNGWRAYAASALRLLVADHPDDAMTTVRTMVNIYGLASLFPAVLVWIDTGLTASGVTIGSLPYTDPMDFHFVTSEGDGIGSGDVRLSAGEVWAGQLITARAVGDYPAFLRIIRTVPDDLDLMVRYLMTVLRCAAAMVASALSIAPW